VEGMEAVFIFVDAQMCIAFLAEELCLAFATRYTASLTFIINTRQVINVI